MPNTELNVVTGSFGYTGKYITRRLLSMGKTVITLTGHPHRQNPFGDQVKVFSFDFDNPRKLAENLRGATTLYNTYWVRFPKGAVTFDRAVANTKKLIEAAKEAGIRRLVHISITSASEDSPLPYFRGKGLVEEAIIQSKLSYAVIRPTVIFGAEDILINNIAWLLRRFPLFAVAGKGNYQVQPIYVEDVAEIAIRASQQADNVIVDAAGPEVYTFDELIRLIAERVRSRAKSIHVGPGLVLLAAMLLGWVVRDVVLTRDEIEGLMSGLLLSRSTPSGHTRLSQWLAENDHKVGVRYASELKRHYRLGAQVRS